MRKLIVEEWLSLDGYASGINGELDFFPSTESNKHSDEKQLEFLETVDTILLGSVTYKLFVGFWPSATNNVEIIADKLNSLHKIVFSNTIKHAPWGNWPAAEVVAGDAIHYVETLKAKEGKNIVLWGSLSLAEAFMKENLVDEYHIQICPTVLGAGRPFFTEPGGHKNLSLGEIRKYETGVVYLQYHNHL